MVKDNDTERQDARAFEADKKRREDAGVPYKIAERLAKRQAELNKKKGKK